MRSLGTQRRSWLWMMVRPTRRPELLRRFLGVKVLRHSRNLGYGAGLKTAFQYAIEGGYDGLVTLDCDGQHEPALIPELGVPAWQMPTSYRGADISRSSIRTSDLLRTRRESTLR